MLNRSKQWRIQDFPEGGAPTPKSAIIFQFFSRKLHENERIWTPRGARPWRPLDPLMQRCHSQNEITNVLATCLLNQMMPQRYIKTWHYDIVSVHRNNLLISRILIRDTKVNIDGTCELFPNWEECLSNGSAPPCYVCTS